MTARGTSPAFSTTFPAVAAASPATYSWYWTVSHPPSQYGVTNLGVITVDTLGEAVITAAFGLVLIPLVLLLARWCATTHAGLAVRLLASVDPGRSHA